MTTLLFSHPCFIDHDTGQYHPERPDRMRAIDKVLGHEIFSSLERREAPIREDADAYVRMAHSAEHVAHITKAVSGHGKELTYVDGDTVVSQGTWEAARRARSLGSISTTTTPNCAGSR